MYWTVSPTAAVTVMGVKVRPLFAPTMTWWFAAKTTAGWINPKTVDFVKCMVKVERLAECLFVKDMDKK